MMGMSSGSGIKSKPLGFMARIDKLGMRAITITKSFFMFVFMIVLILRLTHKCNKSVPYKQVSGAKILAEIIEFQRNPKK